jgi:hypothetical protein
MRNYHHYVLVSSHHKRGQSYWIYEGGRLKEYSDLKDRTQKKEGTNFIVRNFTVYTVYRILLWLPNQRR